MFFLTLFVVLTLLEAVPEHLSSCYAAAVVNANAGQKIANSLLTLCLFFDRDHAKFFDREH